MKCILCNINEAKVPDRTTMSPKKSICLSCHAIKLREDLTKLRKWTKRGKNS